MREHHLLLRQPLSALLAVDVLRIRPARVFGLHLTCILDRVAAISQSALVELALIRCSGVITPESKALQVSRPHPRKGERGISSK